MQKSRIYGVVTVSTIAVCAGVLVMLPNAPIETLLLVAAGVAVSTLVPVLLINLALKKLGSDIEGKNLALRRANDELAHVKSKFAAVTTLDDLTGCSNKRHFLELLLQHRAMSERGNYQFTVAVAQVDQFGEIVERQGLGRGNEVLQLFSRIVKAALREVDAIARLESDKFGLVLSGCSEQHALHIINRISQLISQIQVNDQDDVKITASGGITSYHGTESCEDLIAHAEEALEFAVSQGRDRVAGYNYIEPPSEESA